MMRRVCDLSLTIMMSHKRCIHWCVCVCDGMDALMACVRVEGGSFFIIHRMDARYRVIILVPPHQIIKKKKKQDVKTPLAEARVPFYKCSPVSTSTDGWLLSGAATCSSDFLSAETPNTSSNTPALIIKILPNAYP